MVNVCKGCDVHVFFVEEVIEAVSSIAKGWPKKLRLKGQFTQNFCHHLLTLKYFQTCMNVFVLSTKEDIFITTKKSFLRGS